MRLIMIEGLPGTGKTSIANWLNGHLQGKGIQSTLLLEGDMEIPCDFYETAGIPKQEFEALMAEFPEEFQALREKALVTQNYIYLWIDECPGNIAERIRRWDMGDEGNQNVTAADYVPCALERLEHWVGKVASQSGVVIVDSGFLQNPVNELLFRKASSEETASFIAGIFQRVKVLDPVCVYLQRNNAEEAIDFAREAKGREWTDRVNKLLKDNHCEDLFSRRFDLEQELLPAIAYIKCMPDGYDWTGVKQALEQYFAEYQSE